MRAAQMAYHHQRGSVCNRAPSSRTRLDCDRRAPLERLARPLLRSLRQTASKQLEQLEEQRQKSFRGAKAALHERGHNTEEIDAMYIKAHELRSEIKRINLEESAKAMTHLEMFYRGRQVPYNRRLTLSFLSDGQGRIESQGAEFQETAPPEIKQQKLAEYQEEMRAFTSFLKEKYFSN